MNQHTKNGYRFAVLMLAWICVFALLAPAGVSAEAAKVKTWKELVSAVDAGQTEIILSKGFQQKENTVDTVLVLRGGTTVNVHTADGNATEIKASITVRGENGGGTLLLQNINIVAVSDHPALHVLGEGAKVEAGNLTGGKASVGSPVPVLIAEGDVSVTAGCITGTDMKNTAMGGTGILAIGSARIEAENVTAGNSAKGYGGTAVIASGNAAVNVRGDAKGGDGQIASGWATRAAEPAAVTVLGTASDGTKIEGAKPVTVPAEANDLSALRYMLLRGDTDISLSQSFKYAESTVSQKMFGREYWIAFSDETVRIHRAEAARKNPTFSGTHQFVSGSFEINGIDLSSHHTALFLSAGTEKVVWNGSITSNATDADTVRVEGGSLAVTGDLTQKTGKGGSALTVTGEGATVSITGDITGASATSNAVTVTGGTVTLNGTVRQKEPQSGTALQVSGKDTCVTVSGDIVTVAPQPSLMITDADVTVNGNITAKAANALFANGQAKVRIHGNLTNDGAKPRDKQAYFPCVELTGNADCIIEGTVQSRSGSAIFADGLSLLSVTGNIISLENTAVEENGYADMTLNGTVQSGNNDCYAVILYGAGNVIVQTPPGAVSIGKWASAGAGGSLLLSSSDLTGSLPQKAEQTEEPTPKGTEQVPAVTATAAKKPGTGVPAGSQKKDTASSGKAGNKQDNRQNSKQQPTQAQTATVDLSDDDFWNALANGGWGWFFDDPLGQGDGQEAYLFWPTGNGGDTYFIDMSAGEEDEAVNAEGPATPSNAGHTSAQAETVRHYDQTQQIVDMMNNDRRSGNTWILNENGERVEQGVLGELAVDEALTEVAMKRAEELSEQFSHTRPDGTYVFSENPSIKSENIAGLYQTPEEMYEALLEKNESYDNQGHRRNILDPDATKVGVGYVTMPDGSNYYTMEFGKDPIIQSPAGKKETGGQNTVTTDSGITITLDPSMYYYPGAVYEITETDADGNETVTQFIPNPVEEDSQDQ